MTALRHRREERRAEIVEAARRIIASNGLEGLTVKELAEEVGISEGDIYKHFKSKREVLLSLIEEIKETLLECIEGAIKREGPALVNLENIMKAHLSYTERRRGVSFLVIGEVLRSPETSLRRHMHKVIGAYLQRVKGLLEEGMKRGEVRRDLDLNVAATAFFGLVQGMVTLWAFRSHGLPLAEQYEELWSIYRNGIASQPQQAEG